MNADGGTGILVHGIDNDAQTFYKKFGFKESTFDPLVPWHGSAISKNDCPQTEMMGTLSHEKRSILSGA